MSKDLIFRYTLSEDQKEELLAASAKVHAAEVALSEAAEERKEAVRRALRSGIKQSELAELLGITQPRISIMASGKKGG